jgi:hypothetical protein
VTSETGEIIEGTIPAMTAARNPRNGTGQLVATEEVAERDALILRLLASGRSYQQVVDMHLPGIANKGAVSKARRRALDAIRAPAVHQYRAEMLAKLDELETGAWEQIRSPGPKTSVTGRVIEDPETGEPLPDNVVRDTARNTVLKVVRTRMDLLGMAAPRKSMNLQASVELDGENESLQAQLAEAYAGTLAEKEREIADLRAQLAQASRPPALAIAAGKDGKP